jgi:hypothetical protein
MIDSPLMELRTRAEAALKMKYPDVLGVGFGLREKDGAVTNSPALRVYVKKKRSLDELSKKEILPDSFEDVPIDVLEPAEMVPIHCEDITKYTRMIGGITLSTYKRNQNGQLNNGTLGFFATVRNEAPPKNIVLVSNNHVLGFAGATNGDTVWQAEGIDRSSPPAAHLIQTDLRLDEFGKPVGRVLGKIDNIGQYGPHQFSYDASPEIDYFVDCATARLDIEISSTCNKSTGINYKNEIRGLRIGATAQNPDGNSRIVDIARIRPEDVAGGELDGSNTDPSDDYVVYKVGRRTSRTVGKVVDVYRPSMPGAPFDRPGAFQIVATETDCDNFDRFGAEGDSGAAIINENNELVGILFASGKPPNTNMSFGCHIHPVIEFLQIDPITDANPPIGPAGTARDDQPGAFMPIEAHVVALRERIEAHERAGPLYTGFMEHWDEIVMLVNHRRPLLVAWHRTKGPTFVAHLSESARKPGHRIPFEIDGVSRREVLERMADLLTEEGSSELRAFIAANREEALALIDRFDDLHSFVDVLETEKVDA